MLKRLNTKYLDFINERLVVDRTFEDAIKDLSKSSVVASFLGMISDSDKHYQISNAINFVSISDTLNMLKYPPHHSGERAVWNQEFQTPNQTEIRIGRMVRRIINDCDKTKFKAVFEGKVHFTSMGTRTKISFTNKISGKQFGKYISESEFYFKDTQGSGVSIKISGDVGPLLVNLVDYNDYSYRSYSDDDYSYLEVFISNCKVEGIKNVTIEFENTFHDKTINDINDSDIEKFVNDMMAFIKINKAPENAIIEVVKGDDIRYWYDSDHYQSKTGQLGNSCMSYGLCREFFGIYTENPDSVSLLILKNESGNLVGRALLWKLKDGEHTHFMDRVYCLTEFDNRIFIKYAIDNGYYYRGISSGSPIVYYFNGLELDYDPMLAVELSDANFEYYPYLDTLCWLDLEKQVIHNEVNSLYNCDRELKDTEGKWLGWEGYDD